MRISKYGVELISILSSDLEMVRRWRNQPNVSEFMFFQDEITSEMQQNWFNSLDETAIYLLIVHQGEKIGVINVKNIDWQLRTGEAGIFMGESNYRNSPFSLQAVFALMDAFFFEFNFVQLRASVRADNTNALNFNFHLGYQIESEDGAKINLIVSKEGYSEARDKFIHTLEKIANSEAQIELSEAERNLIY